MTLFLYTLEEMIPLVKTDAPYRLEAPRARKKVSTFTNERNKCNSVLKIVDTRTYGQNRVDSYFTEAPSACYCQNCISLE